jgi:hypothetical protein
MVGWGKGDVVRVVLPLRSRWAGPGCEGETGSVMRDGDNDCILTCPSHVPLLDPSPPA